MTNRDWPKSYMIPSVVLSATCVGFLVWRELAPSKVDAYALGIFAIGFAPWFLPGLGKLLESVAGPFGWSVKFRVSRVEDEQKRQASDIDAVHLLLRSLITEPQRDLLQRLANDEPVEVDDADFAKRNEELRSLHRLALIASNPSFIAKAEEVRKSGHSQQLSTINEMYVVTDAGHDYLRLTADLPDTGSIDPYRPD